MRKKRHTQIVKTNLMFVFFNLGIGGVQRKIVDICNFTNQQKKYANINIHIVLRDQTEFNLLEEINYNNVFVHFRPSALNGYLHIFFPIFIYLKLIQIKPTAILSFLDMSSVYSIISSKLLFWLHIPVFINEDTYTSKKVDSAIKRKLIMLFYPQAKKIISPTQASKIDLINNFNISKNKIAIIPNWTLTNSNNQTKTIDLLFAGRFTKQKNLFYLLEAVKQIKQYFPKINTVLVGEGEDEEAIKLYITNSNLKKNIVMYPTSHKLNELISSSRIFTLTSDYEGMSVVLLEAMALKTPVIVTKIPGINEYITNNKTAIVASNMDEYVQGVIYLLKNKKERTRILHNAFDVVRKKYSFNQIHNYLDLLLKESTYK